MTSTIGVPPATTRSAAASMRARTCIAYRPGFTTPRRTPRVPSMGLNSCQERAAVRSSSSSADKPTVAFLISSSSIRGRNSWSGGSSRRTVTGSPSIASRISMKSAFWTTRSSSRASVSSSRVWARIIRRTTGRRSSPRNMCSVRHNPMPSAPNRRALAASGPLSALARTASFPLRILSAHPRITSNSAGGSDAVDERPRRGSRGPSTRRAR